MTPTIISQKVPLIEAVFIFKILAVGVAIAPFRLRNIMPNRV
jgi:hypothetical protein